MISIFWFRRDLRLEDNAGFSAALQSPYPVLPLFIFDTDILDKLEDRNDARVMFIHQTLQEMQQVLQQAGSTLLIRQGKPAEVWKKLLQELDIAAVYTNHDYETYAQKRDEDIRKLLVQKQIPLHTYKDQVIFEKMEVGKKDESPYTVFTPYSKTWRAKLTDTDLQPLPCQAYFSNLYPLQTEAMLTLKDLHFQPSGIPIPSAQIQTDILTHYANKRDFPAQTGTTRIGIHLRFGTVSIRQLVRQAQQYQSDTWLNELIWREFYMMILSNFPHVETGSFRKEYDRIQWRNNEEEFACWCEGRTGYPLVDAGMRQLNQTGYMHNRVRMIVASFLTKHLLIDWRWGEAYFAQKLLDYELASNNGGWQWAAGCGCDAAPYFRIFNPTAQQEKFDQQLTYIKEWVPEFGTRDYPVPIVEHTFARERVLKTYSQALKPS